MTLDQIASGSVCGFESASDPDLPGDPQSGGNNQEAPRRKRIDDRRLQDDDIAAHHTITFVNFRGWGQ